MDLPMKNVTTIFVAKIRETQKLTQGALGTLGPRRFKPGRSGVRVVQKSSSAKLRQGHGARIPFFGHGKNGRCMGYEYGKMLGKCWENVGKMGMWKGFQWDIFGILMRF